MRRTQAAAKQGIVCILGVQVYLAQWNETLVAAKLLLGEERAESDTVAAADQAVTLSNPVCQGLKQVSRHPDQVREGCSEPWLRSRNMQLGHGDGLLFLCVLQR